jgi:hypothetical protein
MVHNKQLNKINKTPTIIINKGLKPLDIIIESRIILNGWLNEKKEKHCCVYFLLYLQHVRTDHTQLATQVKKKS